ncbi:MAG: hypothetical protein JWN13_1193 [Betaproteobacteria bacterium]|nr:hypothetical protein [Betaproteobacteria bacterium]
MHRDDRIEVVLGHIPDHALTQVSGDVDHDIDLAELIHALLYHQPGFEVVGDGVIVCRSFAAGFPDLCNDIIGGPFLGFFAAASHTRIIDDDVDTFGSQRFCDLTSDSAPRAGDDGRFPLEMHAHPPLLITRRPASLNLAAIANSTNAVVRFDRFRLVSVQE